MCYVLLLSTTSSKDLAIRNNELVRFTREMPDIADVENLRHPHRWYIGSSSGCSCTFRHLHDAELGFGEPAEWYPEKQEDIAATLQLIGEIRLLVAQGDKVDTIDAWEHKEMRPTAESELQVDLSNVTDAEFRLFENYHFLYEQQSNKSLERTRER